MLRCGFIPKAQPERNSHLILIAYDSEWLTKRSLLPVTAPRRDHRARKNLTTRVCSSRWTWRRPSPAPRRRCDRHLLPARRRQRCLRCARRRPPEGRARRLPYARRHPRGAPTLIIHREKAQTATPGPRRHHRNRSEAVTLGLLPARSSPSIGATPGPRLQPPTVASASPASSRRRTPRRLHGRSPSPVTRVSPLRSAQALLPRRCWESRRPISLG